MQVFYISQFNTNNITGYERRDIYVNFLFNLIAISVGIVRSWTKATEFSLENRFCVQFSWHLITGHRQ